MHRRNPVAAVLLALSLTLAGCSSASDGEPSPESVPASASSSSAAGAAPPPLTEEQAEAGESYQYQGVTVTGAPDEAPEVELAPDFAPVTDLAVGDVWLGTGDPVEAGATVTVNYLGLGQASRSEFDSSWSRGQPATFGLDQVIPGWQEGLVGMQVGGRRLLIIPSSMAYGEQGSPPVISPGETLVFVVDLVAAPSGS